LGWDWCWSLFKKGQSNSGAAPFINEYPLGSCLGGMGNFQVFFKKNSRGEQSLASTLRHYFHIGGVGGRKQAMSRMWPKCVSCLGDHMGYVNFVKNLLKTFTNFILGEFGKLM
jgi:hypothetical protein